MNIGICWIDGRRTTVKPRRTIIGTKVDTCADGQGCDSPARRRGSAIVMVMALLALAACAPDSGTVTDRRIGTSCINNVCSTDYRLQITDPNHKSQLYTDQQDTGWATVSSKEYERCPIGAAWPDCKEGPR